jgi:Na+/H+-dicarboxylate symporter
MITFLCDSFSIGMLVVIVVLSLFFSIATPAVPYGGITIYAILLQFFNIDVTAGLPIFILGDMLTNNLVSGANVFFVLLEVQRSKKKKAIKC